MMFSWIIIWLIAFAALFVFALFDYIGYNKLGRNNIMVTFFKWEVNEYRIYQTIFQILLTTVLWWQFSWVPAILFLFMWDVWLADLLYYLFCYIFNWYNHKFAFMLEVLGNEVVWASWTLVGLFLQAYNFIFKKISPKITRVTPIFGRILLIQAAIGLIVSFVIAFIFM